MEYTLGTLKNGIRVLLKPSPGTNITHCCLVANTGSRDEATGKEGLAHLIEHVLFKGTEKRNTYHLLSRMEVVGGELNAYTTKEQTCIHSSFLNEHLDRAADLLSDIMFRSTFPPKEIEKEKSVILDEIDSYKDIPEEAIHDDFEELLFPGHPLGNNILGTPSSVLSVNRDDILDFIKKNYNTSEIIFAVYGDQPWNKVMKIAEKYLSPIPENTSAHVRTAPLPEREIRNEIQERNIFQSHAVVGNVCFSIKDERKNEMALLNNYLGGPGMSSRLNLEIREKHGICYSIDSGYTPYTDSGVFSIYMGTDKEKMDKCFTLLNRELKRVCENKLGSIALHQAKEKFKGQVSLAEENKISVIIAIAKNVLETGESETLETIYKKIDQVIASQIREISNFILQPAQLSSLIFIPTE